MMGVIGAIVLLVLTGCATPRAATVGGEQELAGGHAGRPEERPDGGLDVERVKARWRRQDQERQRRQRRNDFIRRSRAKAVH